MPERQRFNAVREGYACRLCGKWSDGGTWLIGENDGRGGYCGDCYDHLCAIDSYEGKSWRHDYEAEDDE